MSPLRHLYASSRSSGNVQKSSRRAARRRRRSGPRRLGGRRRARRSGRPGCGDAAVADGSRTPRHRDRTRTGCRAAPGEHIDRLLGDASMTRRAAPQWCGPIGRTTGGRRRSEYLDLCVETIERHVAPLELRVLSRHDAVTWLPDLDVERWESLPAPNFRSDYVRSRLLQRYGGIWIDVDTVALSPLSQLARRARRHGHGVLRQGARALLRWPVRGCAGHGLRRRLGGGPGQGAVAPRRTGPSFPTRRWPRT